jgi:hypothetical protein
MIEKEQDRSELQKFVDELRIWNESMNDEEWDEVIRNANPRSTKEEIKDLIREAKYMWNQAEEQGQEVIEINEPKISEEGIEETIKIRLEELKNQKIG